MKKKILSLLLCLSVFISLFVPAGFVAAQTGDTAKITVNYVYEKNNAMAAQPYSATASHFRRQSHCRKSLITASRQRAPARCRAAFRWIRQIIF